MKKILSIQSLVLVSSLSILPLGISVADVQAAPASDTQQVTATVQGVLQIKTPTSTTFNAKSNPDSSKSFNLNVRSNQKDGYEIKVYSANGGKLKNSDASAEFPYTLSASGGAGTNNTQVTLGNNSDSAAMLYSSLAFADEKCASTDGCDFDISLGYDISNLQLPADDYTDTITYEVSAK